MEVMSHRNLQSISNISFSFEAAWLVGNFIFKFVTACFPSPSLQGKVNQKRNPSNQDIYHSWHFRLVKKLPFQVVFPSTFTNVGNQKRTITLNYSKLWIN